MVPCRRLPDDPLEAAALLSASEVPPEVIYQSGGTIAGARNRGAVRTRGDVLIFTDDDIRLEAPYSWFSTRPPSESWWIPATVVSDVDDEFTQMACSVIRFVIPFRGILASGGHFLAVRRSAFEKVGGYSLSHLFEEHGMSRKLFHAFGPPSPSPAKVTILRRTSTLLESAVRSKEAPPDTDGPFSVVWDPETAEDVMTRRPSFRRSLGGRSPDGSSSTIAIASPPRS